MSIWKRIKKLELLEQQRTCLHSWDDMTVAPGYGGTVINVRSKCRICGLEKERRGHGPELSSAFLVLDDFLKNVVREKTDSKKEKGSGK